MTYAQRREREIQSAYDAGFLAGRKAVLAGIQAGKKAAQAFMAAEVERQTAEDPPPDKAPPTG